MRFRALVWMVTVLGSLFLVTGQTTSLTGFITPPLPESTATRLSTSVITTSNQHTTQVEVAGLIPSQTVPLTSVTSSSDGFVSPSSQADASSSDVMSSFSLDGIKSSNMSIEASSPSAIIKHSEAASSIVESSIDFNKVLETKSTMKVLSGVSLVSSVEGSSIHLTSVDALSSSGISEETASIVRSQTVKASLTGEVNNSELPFLHTSSMDHISSTPAEMLSINEEESTFVNVLYSSSVKLYSLNGSSAAHSMVTVHVSDTTDIYSDTLDVDSRTSNEAVITNGASSSLSEPVQSTDTILFVHTSHIYKDDMSQTNSRMLFNSMDSLYASRDNMVLSFSDSSSSLPELTSLSTITSSASISLALDVSRVRTVISGEETSSYLSVSVISLPLKSTISTLNSAASVTHSINSLGYSSQDSYRQYFSNILSTNIVHDSEMISSKDLYSKELTLLTDNVLLTSSSASYESSIFIRTSSLSETDIILVMSSAAQTLSSMPVYTSFEIEKSSERPSTSAFESASGHNLQTTLETILFQSLSGEFQQSSVVISSSRIIRNTLTSPLETTSADLSMTQWPSFITSSESMVHSSSFISRIVATASLYFISNGASAITNTIAQTSLHTSNIIVDSLESNVMTDESLFLSKSIVRSSTSSDISLLTDALLNSVSLVSSLSATYSSFSSLLSPSVIRTSDHSSNTLIQSSYSDIASSYLDTITSNELSTSIDSSLNSTELTTTLIGVSYISANVVSIESKSSTYLTNIISSTANDSGSLRLAETSSIPSEALQTTHSTSTEPSIALPFQTASIMSFSTVNLMTDTISDIGKSFVSINETLYTYVETLESLNISTLTTNIISTNDFVTTSPAFLPSDSHYMEHLSTRTLHEAISMSSNDIITQYTLIPSFQSTHQTNSVSSPKNIMSSSLGTLFKSSVYTTEQMPIVQPSQTVNIISHTRISVLPTLREATSSQLFESAHSSDTLHATNYVSSLSTATLDTFLKILTSVSTTQMSTLTEYVPIDVYSPLTPSLTALDSSSVSTGQTHEVSEWIDSVSTSTENYISLKLISALSSSPASTYQTNTTLDSKTYPSTGISFEVSSQLASVSASLDTSFESDVYSYSLTKQTPLLSSNEQKETISLLSSTIHALTIVDQTFTALTANVLYSSSRTKTTYMAPASSFTIVIPHLSSSAHTIDNVLSESSSDTQNVPHTVSTLNTAYEQHLLSSEYTTHKENSPYSLQTTGKLPVSASSHTPYTSQVSNTLHTLSVEHVMSSEYSSILQVFSTTHTPDIPQLSSTALMPHMSQFHSSLSVHTSPLVSSNSQKSIIPHLSATIQVSNMSLLSSSTHASYMPQLTSTPYPSNTFLLSSPTQSSNMQQLSSTTPTSNTQQDYYTAQSSNLLHISSSEQTPSMLHLASTANTQNVPQLLSTASTSRTPQLYPTSETLLSTFSGHVSTTLMSNILQLSSSTQPISSPAMTSTAGIPSSFHRSASTQTPITPPMSSSAQTQNTQPVVSNYQSHTLTYLSSVESETSVHNIHPTGLPPSLLISDGFVTMDTNLKSLTSNNVLLSTSVVGTMNTLTHLSTSRELYSSHSLFDIIDPTSTLHETSTNSSFFVVLDTDSTSPRTSFLSSDLTDEISRLKTSESSLFSADKSIPPSIQETIYPSFTSGIPQGSLNSPVTGKSDFIYSHSSASSTFDITTEVPTLRTSISGQTTDSITVHETIRTNSMRPELIITSSSSATSNISYTFTKDILNSQTDHDTINPSIFYGTLSESLRSTEIYSFTLDGDLSSPRSSLMLSMDTSEITSEVWSITSSLLFTGHIVDSLTKHETIQPTSAYDVLHSTFTQDSEYLSSSSNAILSVNFSTEATFLPASVFTLPVPGGLSNSLTVHETLYSTSTKTLPLGTLESTFVTVTSQFALSKSTSSVSTNAAISFQLSSTDSLSTASLPSTSYLSSTYDETLKTFIYTSSGMSYSTSSLYSSDISPSFEISATYSSQEVLSSHIMHDTTYTTSTTYLLQPSLSWTRNDISARNSVLSSADIIDKTSTSQISTSTVSVSLDKMNSSSVYETILPTSTDTLVVKTDATNSYVTMDSDFIFSRTYASVSLNTNITGVSSTPSQYTFSGSSTVQETIYATNTYDITTATTGTISYSTIYSLSSPGRSMSSARVSYNMASSLVRTTDTTSFIASGFASPTAIILDTSSVTLTAVIDSSASHFPSAQSTTSGLLTKITEATASAKSTTVSAAMTSLFSSVYQTIYPTETNTVSPETLRTSSYLTIYSEYLSSPVSVISSVSSSYRLTSLIFSSMDTSFIASDLTTPTTFIDTSSAIFTDVLDSPASLLSSRHSTVLISPASSDKAESANTKTVSASTKLLLSNTYATTVLKDSTKITEETASAKSTTVSAAMTPLLSSAFATTVRNSSLSLSDVPSEQTFSVYQTIYPTETNTVSPETLRTSSYLTIYSEYLSSPVSVISSVSSSYILTSLIFSSMDTSFIASDLTTLTAFIGTSSARFTDVLDSPASLFSSRHSTVLISPTSSDKAESANTKTVSASTTLLLSNTYATTVLKDSTKITKATASAKSTTVSAAMTPLFSSEFATTLRTSSFSISDLPSVQTSISYSESSLKVKSTSQLQQSSLTAIPSISDVSIVETLMSSVLTSLSLSSFSELGLMTSSDSVISSSHFSEGQLTSDSASTHFVVMSSETVSFLSYSRSTTSSSEFATSVFANSLTGTIHSTVYEVTSTASLSGHNMVTSSVSQILSSSQSASFTTSYSSVDIVTPFTSIQEIVSTYSSFSSRSVSRSREMSDQLTTSQSMTLSSAHSGVVYTTRETVSAFSSTETLLATMLDSALSTSSTVFVKPTPTPVSSLTSPVDATITSSSLRSTEATIVILPTSEVTFSVTNLTSASSDYGKITIVSSFPLTTTPVSVIESVSGNLTTVFVPVSPSTSAMSSSSRIVPTTTKRPPEVTTLNATTAEEPYWIKTVLKIRRTFDIASDAFKKDLEQRLAEAYNEAFIRQQLIKEGKFEPLKRRRRKKRFTTVGDASVHVRDISREPGTSSVSALYTVERDGRVLTATEAVDALAALDTQEVAIILGQVLETKAEPYLTVESVPADDEESKLWLIGAIAGPLVFFLIFIWVALCIYYKCPRRSRRQQFEPELMSIQQSPQKVTDLSSVKEHRQLPDRQFPHQSSRGSLASKVRVYEADPTPEPDITAGHNKSNNRPASAQSRRNGTILNDTPLSSPKTSLAPPKPKRSKTPRRNSVQPLNQEEPLVSVTISPIPSHLSDKSFLLQSSVSDDNEELQHRARLERRRNKDRLREKRRRERDEDRRETDFVESRNNLNALGLASSSVPSLHVESEVLSDGAKVSRQDSGVCNADENLDEARNRMHTLLDEAFSLITPRASMTESDLRHNITQMSTPSQQSEESKTDSGPAARWAEPKDPQRGKDVKHEPMFVSSVYSGSYSDFPLETWSPYRSFDQMALISMPQKLDPVPTKLGRKSETTEIPQKAKRPAATFDFPESKSATAIDDTKYTNNPPKPIVLRTKDLTKQQSDSAKSNNASRSNGRFSATGINGDVYLTGSTTSISAPKPNKSAERIELKSFQNGQPRKHKAPSRDIRNNDEVDIINNLQPADTSGDLLQSLRDELNVLKENYKDPTSGKRRKSTARTMTEIV